MIPRLLHQIWIGDAAPPTSVLTSAESWQTHAPQFARRLWTLPELVAAYGETAGIPAHQSNYYRVRILGDLGGVYADADTEAYAGAGEELAAACAGNDLLAATMEGMTVYDNTPIGAAPGLPGWGGLADDPGNLMVRVNDFLQTVPSHAALPGKIWNASKPGPGVLVVHRRRTLSPRPPSGPGVRIVLDTPVKRNAWAKGELVQEPSDFQVVAMRKSGHHAVMRWAMALTGRLVHHFNDCVALPGGLFRTLHGDMSAMRQGTTPAVRVCNFEDHVPGSNPLLGSRKLLVLRSPLNCFASRIRGLERVPGMAGGPAAKRWLDVDLWVRHAEEFLGHTSLLGGKLIRLNFDRWASDRRYRDAWAMTHFGVLPDAEAERQRLSVGAPGESMFDGTAYDGRAPDMGVLDRWEEMAGHPLMAPVLRDGRLALWERVLDEREEMG